jgi:hypothetical protein
VAATKEAWMLAAISGLCFLTVYWQLRPGGMVPSLTPESTR